MNREKFNKAVFAEFDKYKKKVIENGIEYVFNSAYEINKTRELRDALTNMEDDIVKDLYPYVKNILNNLYAFELEYNVPMFADWDSIEIMVSDYLRYLYQRECAHEAGKDTVQHLTGKDGKQLC